MFNSEKVFAISLKRYQSSVICFVKTRNRGVYMRPKIQLAIHAQALPVCCCTKILVSISSNLCGAH